MLWRPGQGRYWGESQVPIPDGACYCENQYAQAERLWTAREHVAQRPLFRGQRDAAEERAKEAACKDRGDGVEKREEGLNGR